MLLANKQNEYMMLANKYYFIFVQVALKSSCSQCLIRFHIPTYIYSLGHSQVIFKKTLTYKSMEIIFVLLL